MIDKPTHRIKLKVMKNLLRWQPSAWESQVINNAHYMPEHRTRGDYHSMAKYWTCAQSLVHEKGKMCQLKLLKVSSSKIDSLGPQYTGFLIWLEFTLVCMKFCNVQALCMCGLISKQVSAYNQAKFLVQSSGLAPRFEAIPPNSGEDMLTHLIQPISKRWWWNEAAITKKSAQINLNLMTHLRKKNVR